MTKEKIKTETPLDEKQWQYESDDDKTLGIETWTGLKGEKEKRARLSDGRTAIVRMLKGRDVKDVQRQTGGDVEKFQSAVVALSTKIDDERIVLEELDDLWFGDYTKLMTMATINFPSTPGT